MKKKAIFFFLIFTISYSSLQADESIETPIEELPPTTEEFAVTQDEPMETPVEEVPPTTEGLAATQSAEESKNSHKTWRRVGLIAAGVAVATLAIYSVSQNQGHRVCK